MSSKALLRYVMRAHRIRRIAFWFAALAMILAGDVARGEIPVGRFTDVIDLGPNVNSADEYVDARTVAHNTPSARYCTVRVYYPFHPLNGRDLKLLRPYKKSTESVVVVDPVDRRLVIPKWMTLPESATCRVSTTATLNARALYAIAELVELHSDNNTPQ